MATKSIVPRPDGEGGIGTAAKKWGAGYFTTPTAGDNSNKAATTEFVKDAIDTKAANYLPLAGGTMTGAIKGNPLTLTGDDGNGNSASLVCNANGKLTWSGEELIFSDSIPIIHRSNDNTQLTICGGSTILNGASLILDGKNTANGAFNLTASNGTDSAVLAGYSNGSLTWDGQPVQTSSDKRIKTDFADIPDKVLDAWGKIKWQQFKYIADKKAKGDNSRYHAGLVAQDVENVCKGDILKYGILCHDSDKDKWTVRYTEALAMEAAYQRRRADKLEERIAALEERLNHA